MKNKRIQHLLLLNFGMLCLSTSGVLGRLIQLPPPLIIWYRAFFALLFIGAFCWWKKYDFRFDVKEHGLTIFLSGVFMAGNFVCYFYALQWSNVAIGMLALFTFPVMTTLLEPLFFKSKFQWIHLVLAGMVLLGIYFLAPSFDMDNSMTQGLFIGLVAAFSWTIRNLLMKRKITVFNSSILMFYQLLVCALVLLPVLFIFEMETVPSQIPYLLFLGLVTTAIGHTLFLNSFKHFSVSTASIMSSIQPIFGIIVAMLVLGEIPSGRSIIGGALILLTVVIESRRTMVTKS
ncbi:MAG: DMT family transporter [Saprospiraceae bacterium]